MVRTCAWGCAEALLTLLSRPAADVPAAKNAAWRKHLAEMDQQEGWLKPRRKEVENAKVHSKRKQRRPIALIYATESDVSAPGNH